MAHNPTMPGQTQMPRYRTIQPVYALTIKELNPDTERYGNYVLSFVEPDFAPISVTAVWYRTWPIQPGDKYVVRDGRATGMFLSEFERDHIPDVASQDIAMALVKMIQSLEESIGDSGPHTPQQILNAAIHGTPL